MLINVFGSKPFIGKLDLQKSGDRIVREMYKHVLKTRNSVRECSDDFSRTVWYSSTNEEDSKCVWEVRADQLNASWPLAQQFMSYTGRKVLAQLINEDLIYQLFYDS